MIGATRLELLLSNLKRLTYICMFILIAFFLYFRLIYNLTHHRMFTSKVWTDDSRLLQESNLAARHSTQGAASRHTGNYELRTCPRSLVTAIEVESNQRPYAPNTTTLPTMPLSLLSLHDLVEMCLICEPTVMHTVMSIKEMNTAKEILCQRPLNKYFLISYIGGNIFRQHLIDVSVIQELLTNM